MTHFLFTALVAIALLATTTVAQLDTLDTDCNANLVGTNAFYQSILDHDAVAMTNLFASSFTWNAPDLNVSLHMKRFSSKVLELRSSFSNRGHFLNLHTCRAPKSIRTFVPRASCVTTLIVSVVDHPSRCCCFNFLKR